MEQTAMPDDAEIRSKLREAFRTFALPRTMPTAGTDGHEVIAVNGGRNKPCSVCGEAIPSTAEGSLALTYPGGRRFYFHERCAQLWEQERYRPVERK
jgi:hypothetical protein